MINYLCGPRDVAIYSVAYAVGNIINLVTNSINSTFAPYQYQKLKSGEYNLLAQRADQVLGFVAIMLLAIMLFSREIVLIFGGVKYIESIEVIIPICIGIYFNYMFQLFARVQEYYERKITVIIPSILCAVSNIILNYIFIRLCGYRAAAYTTFFCYLIFCWMHYAFYRKVCREELNDVNLYNTRNLLVISMVIIVAGFFIMIINHMIWIKYSILAIVLLVSMIKYQAIINYIKTILNKV